MQEQYLVEACALAELAQTLETWKGRVSADMGASFGATAVQARRCAQKLMELDRLDHRRLAA